MSVSQRITKLVKGVDPLIVLIILAVLVAIVAPARGQFAEWFAVATNLAIALLFFLYGARLSTREALAGLTNWKLHLTILAFTFVIYPLLGLALYPLTFFISDELYRGILFLTLVPSTVQSSGKAQVSGTYPTSCMSAARVPRSMHAGEQGLVS